MNKTIAYIKDGQVQTAVWSGDQTWWDSMIAQGYNLIDVTSVSPQPGPGWTYDGITFTPPIDQGD